MSGEHEIEGLLATTMAQLRQIVDVNTIVGEVIESNGVSVIPVSRLSCGFAAGLRRGRCCCPACFRRGGCPFCRFCE